MKDNKEVRLEQVYKTMKRAGVANIVLGIVLIVFSVATGVCMLINGARLLQRKSNILF
ncbi:MAG: hypothetical protein K6F97_05240 [Lachnospiraceae bacterium]|jgi:hypothetical protein|nr:hypothetical protein [Lachnospiraceae bacterium]